MVTEQSFAVSSTAWLQGSYTITTAASALEMYSVGAGYNIFVLARRVVQIFRRCGKRQVQAQLYQWRLHQPRSANCKASRLRSSTVCLLGRLSSATGGRGM